MHESQTTIYVATPYPQKIGEPLTVENITKSVKIERGQSNSSE